MYLGAAPGVGKTYRMLQEGHRRAERGTDVVIGIVETHGRARTAELIDGLEVIPRRRFEHRGTLLDELDVEAIVARRPEVVLVDELAHTNAPGSATTKRWEDVDIIRDAGIDVITTVNIQHLESLNDALFKITGVEQAETVPDAVVRAADQIEFVDMAPEALHRRMEHGNVYPKERVDAALGNYFRIGNLTALRELALLWVADRVEEDLQQYRSERQIDRPWETRERLVVAITASPSGDALVRRAARMAQRSRAELLGVHVRRSDGLGDGDRDDAIAAHRQLLVDLGGHYHEVVGDDAARQLVAFARAENATQLVLGTSRRGRFDELLHGSVINRLIRNAPDLDVHVIAHPPDPGHDSMWRRPSESLRRHQFTMRRRVLAWLLAVAGPIVLAAGVAPLREKEGLPGVLPAFLLLVVIVALVGGTRPAVIASVSGFVIGNAWLTQPFGSLRITRLSNAVGLFSFLAVGAFVAVIVGRLGRQTLEAETARTQATALASAAATLADVDPVPELLGRLRTLLELDAMAVIDGDGTTIISSGDESRLTGSERIDLPDGRHLVTSRPVADAQDRLVLRAFGDQLAVGLRRAELSTGAARAESLAEADRFRTALLRSVSHDLRTPLAAIKAAGSSLQQDDVDWPVEAQHEFLATIVEESDRLDRIVANLLDASRLEAGVLSVQLAPVDLGDVVSAAIATVDLHQAVDIGVDVQVTTPDVLADAGLLERALENIVMNAARHSPEGLEVAASGAVGGRVSLSVTDHGPGVSAERRRHMYDPFQQLDDRNPGVGLGLSVAEGFVSAMGGTLEAVETDGGGLTMIISLPVADGVRVS